MKVTRIVGLALMVGARREHSQRAELDTSNARAQFDRSTTSAA